MYREPIYEAAWIFQWRHYYVAYFGRLIRVRGKLAEKKMDEWVDESKDKERLRELCGATVAGEAAATQAGGSCVRRANNLVSNHLTHVTRWL